MVRDDQVSKVVPCVPVHRLRFPAAAEISQTAAIPETIFLSPLLAESHLDQSSCLTAALARCPASVSWADPIYRQT